MNYFSNLGVHLTSGISSVFQFILFPVNMIRRYSYSLITILANRWSYRGIKDNCSSSTSNIESEAVSKFSKKEDDTYPMLKSIAQKDNVQTEIQIVMNEYQNENNDTIINLSLIGNDDDPAALTGSIAATQTYKKRPSISEEIEQYLPVEKKPKLLTWSPVEPIEPAAAASEIQNILENPVENPFQLKNVEVLESSYSVLASNASGNESAASTSSAFATHSKEGQGAGYKLSKYRKEDKRHGDNRNAKFDKPRMNYFIGIQVKNPEVRLKIKSVQEEVLSASEKIQIANPKGKRIDFRSAMIPLEKLHFTLHVVYLKDDEDIEKAKQSVESVWLRFRDELKSDPLVLSIRGIGHFKNSVVFAKLNGEAITQRLTLLSEALKERFESEKIFGETRPFQPHMTIAKMSRSDKFARMKIWKFPREMWSGFDDVDFGLQEIDELQLLCMKGVDPTGYYKFLARFPIGDNRQGN